MIETSLAPGLLLAMPQLLDANFSHAVVLMIEHNDEGSFGLVMNQPSPLLARDFLESFGIAWKGGEEDVIWRGGPVMPGFDWILHDPIAGIKPAASGAKTVEDAIESSGSWLISPELALSSGTMERLRGIATAPPPHVRLVLGYAGWGPGQLAQEMARGSWLHADVSLELLFDTPPDEMWERALRSLGIGPESIVQSMGIH